MDQAVKAWSVELRTLDGQSLTLDSPPWQTVLEAAEAARWRLPSQCRQGGCGACRAQVLSGEYSLGPHNPAALPADPPGSVLLCRTTACSDLSIALPYERARIAGGPMPRREAELIELERDGASTVRLALRLLPDADGVAVAEFEPGQFVELEVPGHELRRAYSMANTGNWDGHLEFLIRLQPRGRFSAWLREEAAPGQRLVVHGPQGAFGLRENGLRPRWFVAGGTGLAPLLSMLRRMAEFQEPQPTRLFLGVTREADLFAGAALAELPGLQLTVCVWRPEGDWRGEAGTPAEALRRALAACAPQAWPDLYLCGPAALVEAAEAAARDAGVPATQVYSERFVAG
ncbi:2Fe-2S iron-sulfur cluster-binding protein [Azohydromonas caseinilytica]|uniref:2Fe-2S iron-sulfur cluster binding domain-containing protein n=1 Tax=Azohydromonas caseinilytica TaxID=2728836 RepID=A0A848FCT9_9BURK|nr:2Fe-2S iron-sulfur cluster binding domain-containing protein [Azohydromonas caseinilytica]NML15980.1 2Fe-2S iron-sulfur cluster binding domain-containing protein [Azohydromonas caseinilytica]